MFSFVDFAYGAFVTGVIVLNLWLFIQLLRTRDRPEKIFLTVCLIIQAITIIRLNLCPIVARVLAFPYLDILFNVLVHAWLVPDTQLLNWRNEQPGSVPWAFRLLTSWRGVGWKWQVKSVPKGVPRGYPERRFLFETAIGLCIAVAASDIMKGAMAIIVNTGLMEYRPVKLTLPVFYWAAAWANLNGSYLRVVLACIALGLSEPHECPPFFGDIRDAYTIRNFWGKLWHQKIRHFVQKPAVAIARALGLIKGSLGSRYLQLALSFVFSGLYHDLAYSIGLPMSFTYTWIYGSIILWIIVEDMAIEVGRRLGIHRHVNCNNLKMIGYGWTLLWAAHSGKALLLAGSGGQPMLQVAMNTWTYSAAKLFM